MKKEYIELIKFISNHQPCSGADISSAMKVSLRTVRKYVSDIHLLYPNLIKSSHSGYTISDKDIKSFSNNKEQIPQNRNERINYILKSLLLNESEPIDIYQLCEELYISISTLNSDINSLKDKLNTYSLTVSIKKNKLSILGLERNKRKLISTILYDETDSNFLNFDSIQNYFNNIDIMFIKEEIIRLAKKYNYFISDFSLHSLVLHIAISIDRIQNGNTSSSKPNNQTQSFDNEYLFAAELIESLKKHFNIIFTDPEKNELYLILMSRISNFDRNNAELNSINCFIDNKYIQITNDIIESLHNYYDFDFSGNDFITRFSIHLQDLFTRNQNEYFNKNPLTKNIKESCPFLFETAIYVANILNSKYKLKINEDETAYIAIHLGTMIEEQRSNSNKLNVAVFCPSYISAKNSMIKILKTKYADKLFISALINEQNQLQCIDNTDLIISIIDIDKETNIPSIQVTPLLNEKDQQHLDKKITYLIEQKKESKLFTYFSYIFKSELFEKVDEFSTKNECLKYMTNKLIQKHYTDTNFYADILERENFVSTAMGCVAIPHSMKMNASRTALNIIILQKPIQWDDKNQVSLIIMLCFNKSDRQIFNYIFEPLIDILSDADNIKKLVLCDDYQNFTEKLFQMIHDII